MPVPRSLLGHDGFVDLDLELASGRWPDDLAGEIAISASDQATATRHAFFGDGWMLRLSLEPGTHGAPADRFAWRTSLLRTPSRLLRQRTPEVFESTAIGTSSPYGWANSANTAPLPWGDRLFATWDAGRPVEVDPVTLEALGEVCHRDHWGSAIPAPVLPLVPTTAHPVIDPERDCLWTVALDPIHHTVRLVRWSGDGTELDTWPLIDAPVPQSMHTITQTPDHLILADCAFKADPAEIFGTGEREVTNNLDEPVYLIRKDVVDATRPGDPVQPTCIRVGPEVMHYFARYDERDGIEIIFEHTPATDLAMYVRDGDLDAWGRPIDPGLRGMYNHPMQPAVLAVRRFDPATGEVTEQAVASDPERWWSTQLSAMDWSSEGMAHPTLHHVVLNGFHPETITQRAMALYGDRVADLPTHEIPGRLVTFRRDGLTEVGEHVFADGDHPTSPTFVPRDPLGGSTANGRSRYAGTDPGGHDGYVVVPVLADDGFRVEVFAADAVASGPLAVLRSAGRATVPFILHSAWMPRAVPSEPDLERLRFSSELDDAAVATLAPDQAQAVRAVADELG